MQLDYTTITKIIQDLLTRELKKSTKPSIVLSMAGH